MVSEKIDVDEELVEKICDDLSTFLDNMKLSGFSRKEIISSFAEDDDFREFVKDYLSIYDKKYATASPEKREHIVNLYVGLINKRLLINLQKSLAGKISYFQAQKEIWYVRKSLKSLQNQLKNLTRDIFNAPDLDENQARKVRTMESAAAILLKVLIAREKSLMQEIQELQKKMANVMDEVDLTLEEAPVEALQPPPL